MFILKGVLITKQAQVVEAFRSRHAAEIHLMDLKVEVESIASALAKAEKEEAEAEAGAPPALVQNISLAQLQLLRMAAHISLPTGKHKALRMDCTSY